MGVSVNVAEEVHEIPRPWFIIIFRAILGIVGLCLLLLSVFLSPLAQDEHDQGSVVFNILVLLLAVLPSLSVAYGCAARKRWAVYADLFLAGGMLVIVLNAISYGTPDAWGWEWAFYIIPALLVAEIIVGIKTLARYNRG